MLLNLVRYFMSRRNKMRLDNVDIAAPDTPTTASVMEGFGPALDIVNNLKRQHWLTPDVERKRREIRKIRLKLELDQELKKLISD